MCIHSILFTVADSKFICLFYLIFESIFIYLLLIKIFERHCTIAAFGPTTLSVGDSTNVEAGNNRQPNYTSNHQPIIADVTFPKAKAATGCNINQYPVFNSNGRNDESDGTFDYGPSVSSWLPWNWLLKKERLSKKRTCPAESDGNSKKGDERCISDSDNYKKQSETDRARERRNQADAEDGTRRSVFMVKRGDCMFEDKAVIAQAAGAVAVVVANTEVSCHMSPSDRRISFS